MEAPLPEPAALPEPVVELVPLSVVPEWELRDDLECRCPVVPVMPAVPLPFVLADVPDVLVPDVPSLVPVLVFEPTPVEDPLA